MIFGSKQQKHRNKTILEKKFLDSPRKRKKSKFRATLCELEMQKFFDLAIYMLA
jgi:hypothetical protein